MPAFPDHQPQVRRVVLPSGKTIEVVYFEDVALPRAVGPEAVASDLHVCRSCGCELVQPVDWEEAGPGHWTVELRCPNCERRSTGTYSQQAVDRFDELLDSGTELLVGELEQLTHANTEGEIERFAQALTAELIVPEDF